MALSGWATSAVPSSTLRARRRRGRSRWGVDCSKLRSTAPNPDRLLQTPIDCSKLRSAAPNSVWNPHGIAPASKESSLQPPKSARNNVCTYIYTHTVYIYIYISVCVCVYIYIYGTYGALLEGLGCLDPRPRLLSRSLPSLRALHKPTQMSFLYSLPKINCKFSLASRVRIFSWSDAWGIIMCAPFFNRAGGLTSRCREVRAM